MSREKINTTIRPGGVFTKGLNQILGLILIFGHLFLSPACGRRPWSGDYKTPSVPASVRLSRFYINLNISFIYKHIFKFTGNVYGYENLSLQNFDLTLKTKWLP